MREQAGDVITQGALFSALGGTESLNDCVWLDDGMAISILIES